MAEIRTTLPCFAELPAAQRTKEAVQAAAGRPFPVVFMRLADLEAERWRIRGVYESSLPTIDVPLALEMGRSATQYLTRQPDWRKARRQNDRIVLVEVTPIEVVEYPTHGPPLGRLLYNLNYRWEIRVLGEAEQKRQCARDHGIYPSGVDPWRPCAITGCLSFAPAGEACRLHPTT